MTIGELSSFLSDKITLSFQENYDNSGLQLGEPKAEVKLALLCLDVTDKVLAEAISLGANIIISHHPLIFGGLKSLTGSTPAEQIIIKAIKKDIAIYSAHTNLDIIEGGVSYKMASKLGLSEVKALSPLKDHLLKIATYVPMSHYEAVKKAMFGAGAGQIGNYDHCSFSSEGTGTFRANDEANPYIGKLNEEHAAKELKIEMMLPVYKKNAVVSALINTHPYEEVAYDIYKLENILVGAGLGCVGKLKNPIKAKDFLENMSKIFSAKGIRYAGNINSLIKTVALCGGSGASLIGKASSTADIFITGDVKYHSFFDANSKFMICDIGHYESEEFATEILYDIITEKFPKFAVRFSKINTNPISYL